MLLYIIGRTIGELSKLSRGSQGIYGSFCRESEVLPANAFQEAFCKAILDSQNANLQQPLPTLHSAIGPHTLSLGGRNLVATMPRPATRKHSVSDLVIRRMVTLHARQARPGGIYRQHLGNRSSHRKNPQPRRLKISRKNLRLQH